MNSFLEIYQEFKKIDNIEDIAYERLFENYIKLNLKNDDKIVDIESTNQEKIVLKISPAIPGMIYTFINLNKENVKILEDIKKGKLIKFHDFVPILFCTSYDDKKNIIKGLNLNMLPNFERLKFLEAFYQAFKPFFEKIEETIYNNKPALNEKFIQLSLNKKNSDIFKKFNKIYNEKFDFAYRSYNLKNLINYRMIEYEEWRYIPFFNPKNSFKKINFDKIYEAYKNIKYIK